MVKSMMERKRLGKLGVSFVVLFFASLAIGVIAIIYGLREGGAVLFLPWSVKLNNDLVVTNFSDIGPLSKTNLEVGDTITKIGDIPVRSREDMIIRILDYKAGNTFTLTFKRGDQEKLSNITIPESIEGYLSIVGFLFGLIGFIVYLKKTKDEVSTIFYLLCLTAMLFFTTYWVVGVGFIFWIFKGIYSLSSFFMRSLMLHFVLLLFPEEMGILKRRYFLFFIYAPSSILALVYIIESIYHYFYLNEQFREGILIRLKIDPITFAICLVLAVFSLILSYRFTHDPNRFTHDPNMRKKIELSIWSTVITGIPFIILFVAVNLLDFLNYNLYYVYLISRFSLILIPIAISYSIIRHNLFEIELIIKRGVVYTLIAGTVTAFYTLIIALLNIPLRQLELTQSYFFPIIFTLAVVFVFLPLHNRIQKLVEKIFFKSKYDFEKVIGQISRTMTSFLNLEEILDYIIRVLLDTINVKTCSVLLPSNEAKEFRPLRVGGDRSGEIEKVSLREDNTLIKAVEKKNSEISKYDIQEDFIYEDERKEFLQQLDKLGATLLVPITFKEQLRGLITIGDKKSEEPFTTQDLEIVRVLANDSAISIENAHAYEAISKKANELSSVHAIGTAITSILEMDQLLDTLSKTVVQDLGFDRAMIMLVDEERNTLSGGRTLGETEAEITKYVENLEIPLNEEMGVLAQVALSGRPILISDVNKPDTKINIDIVRALKSESFLAVPLKAKEKVIGVMAVDNSISRVKLTENDSNLLSTLALQVAISIENARLVEEVAEKESIKRGLEVARNIQIGLLPQHDPKPPGFELVGRSIPAEEVGGDFYYYYQMDGGKLGIAIGDVSGKGISAAMLMAVISGIIDSEAKKNGSVADLIMDVNRLLIPRAKPSKMNSALLYTILDIREKKLRVANAGEIAPLVCRNNGGGCDYMDVTGFPLGMTTIGEYVERELELETGDTVVLSSDGIVEAMDSRGEMFGFDRFRDMVYQNRELSASDLSDKILSEVKDFVGKETSQDDITIVVLKTI